MAPSRVLTSQRTPIARGSKSEVGELSQSEPQSSDDNHVTKLAMEMQREARKRREARRNVITKSYWEAVKKIESAMTLKFEEVKKRMVKRHRLRMERLSYLIRKRSAIEAKMLASFQNIEHAFIYADKALTFAFELRMQRIAEQKKVVPKNSLFIVVEAHETLRRRLHNETIHNNESAPNAIVTFLLIRPWHSR